jgi:hypothetical protein
MIARLSLVLFACAIVVPLATGCGGGGTPKTIRDVSSTSGPANDSHAAPTSQMPVSRFALSLDDLDPSTFRTDVRGIYELDTAGYADTDSFDSVATGKKMLQSWGYKGGYEAGYLPISAPQSVLNGAYYINIEVHLFKDQDGAKKAYDYFKDRIHKSGAKEEDAPKLGNESIGFSSTGSKVPGTDTAATAERFLFRRGNIVGIVFTFGATGFMNINTSRHLAQIEDNKILGKQRAPVPTPPSNFTPNTGTGQGVKPTTTATAQSTAAGQ